MFKEKLIKLAQIEAPTRPCIRETLQKIPPQSEEEEEEEDCKKT